MTVENVSEKEAIVEVYEAFGNRDIVHLVDNIHPDLDSFVAGYHTQSSAMKGYH